MPIANKVSERFSPSSLPTSVDADRDGIPDQLEQQLAEKYAPELLFDPSEANYPINVTDFLASSGTNLLFYEQCSDNANSAAANKLIKAGPLTLKDLLDHTQDKPICSADNQFTSLTSEQLHGGVRHETFYLSNVNVAARVGSLDPSRWVTYYHAYPTNDGGIMIQYWHFFAYNAWHSTLLDNCCDQHGGDWDASIQVQLNKDQHSIEGVWYSRHNHDHPGDMMQHTVAFSSVSAPTQTNTAYLIGGTHPIVMLDSGGHGAFASPADNCNFDWNSTRNLADANRIWGDPSNANSLMDVNCLGTKPFLTHTIGGTTWDTVSTGAVTQAGNVAHKISGNTGGLLLNLGEYNPGNMGTCNNCVGLKPSVTDSQSFQPLTAGVFTKYAGLWGSPNANDNAFPGYPPNGPVFQGYVSNNAKYYSWYNQASSSAKPN